MSTILLISNHGGGFYNFKKELVEELLKIGFEVHFVVPFDEKTERLEALGAVFHKIDIDRRGINPIKDLSLMNQLRKVIKTVRPDALILHTIKPNIYASILARIYKIPYINNITGLGSALQQNSKMAKLLRFLYRNSLAGSSGIFFENSGNRDYFLKYHIGRQEKYVLVPGAGVNIAHFKKGSGKTGSVEFTNFLFIGRIMKEKGIDEFFEAAAHIKGKYSDVKLQVVGFYDEPEYECKVRALTDQRIIEFLGASSDTRLEMSYADCIVLPSYHEGMSNVLLEGASMGLPLITTDIPGCREAVRDGKSGFLCNVKDAQSLIDAMERFLALSPAERDEMGRVGREKMEREFDRNIVVNRYIQSIQSALKE